MATLGWSSYVSIYPLISFFSYLNKLKQLCEMKRDATTVEEFLNLQHLDDALAIRAAFKVHGTMNKISRSKEKKL